MTTTRPAPRPADQRREAVLERLRTEEDVWVATANPRGVPCLVPLSVHWDGDAVWLSTRGANPTGRNLLETSAVRISFGDTRDVVLIDGSVEAFSLDEVDPADADAFAARCGWDPRRAKRPGSPYLYFRVTPTDVQAFHGEHELTGRHLMRDGLWTVPAD
ncbi:pyridoxamine 5'-phosphate oxidase family protein [Streptomyces sp. DSM 42041]|uniref:Pyridoxamine 5'-phosphate oxidase family protein n=1 Tax=Streptomyces hazeniae TaxID=3075538 RepID=A0ABU2NL66_9ACTN|nr:pyridoxamine 5'-phosphate oxidase family protein [Streptomyces sp. DSM 42041]MDT0377500.1 pyridoxamine 5'-phosphate oxidase family protein [Streptomyces sp. DSM 42041]